MGYGLDLATKTLALAHLDPTNPPRLFGGLLTLPLCECKIGFPVMAL